MIFAILTTACIDAFIPKKDTEGGKYPQDDTVIHGHATEDIHQASRATDNKL